MSFRFAAFLGSNADAGIGVDFVIAAACLPQPETCNGLDDDCDGNVDEGFNVGDVCARGVGACSALGITLCTPAGFNTCTANPGEPELERCDAVDNDCDGLTDEGFNLGTPCSAGVGACLAQGEVLCDGVGGAACSAQPSYPVAEICNGADDDCDATTDEGLSLPAVASFSTITINGLGAVATARWAIEPDQAGLSFVDGNLGFPNAAATNFYTLTAAEIPALGSPTGFNSYLPTGEVTPQAGVGIGLTPDSYSGLTYVAADLGLIGPLSFYAIHHRDTGDYLALMQPSVPTVTDHKPMSAPGGPLTAGESGYFALSFASGDLGWGANLFYYLRTNALGETVFGSLVPALLNGPTDRWTLGAGLGYTDLAFTDTNVGVGASKFYYLRLDPATQTSFFGWIEPTTGVATDIQDLGGLYRTLVFTPTNVGYGANSFYSIGQSAAPIEGLGEACELGEGACREQGLTACAPDGSVMCNAQLGVAIAESCNGIDDDCDGSTDEELGLGTACDEGVGACAGAGVLVCAPDGSTTCDGVPGLPSAELCNGIDDNCDGSIDDGLGLGTDCSEGIGACLVDGQLVCDAYGGVRCSAMPLPPRFELCNGIDDNCDGSIDEGLGLGDNCGSGVGACHTEGEIICGAVGGTVCSAQPGYPAQELCNGIDDNCNGSIDENLTLACGSDIGACAAGLSTCVAGQYGACVGAVGPVAETCNGLDDNCNGSADEGLGLGAACNAGVGACADAGVMVCAPDGTVACDAVASLPAAELCNGIDDNCNGSTDENLTQACGSDIGACAAGVSTCVAGQYGACVGDIGPVAETCNGIDDNCDGNTDEGFNLGAACVAGVGACSGDGQIVCDARGGAICDAQPGVPAAELCNGLDDNCDGSIDENLTMACGSDIGACAAGVSTCEAGEYGACVGDIGPVAELCNGIDDNCEGQIDEGFNLGAACFAGVGACSADGQIVCDANGGSLCNAQPGYPAEELCNGLDDNCDGSIDENLTMACGSDIGACAAGVSTCVAGQYGACVGDIGPVAELCNGIDDNCEGQIDEGFNLGAACFAGVGACSADGQIVCDAHGGSVCDAQPGYPAEELCNGLDDNCDGSIDDNLTQACGSDIGACAAGVSTCVAGVYGACVGDVGPAYEVCNGIDDNCDGHIDEDLGLGAACNVGVGACADAGVMICAPDGTVTCDAVAGLPAAELCNGLDDNCDGSIDEDLTQTCGSDVGACAAGVRTCEAGQYGACVGDIGPVGELCNGIDDNCDGSIDENLTMACGSDIGACAAGVSTCVAGAYGACVGDVGPAYEACNGLDDNCDGHIDENLGLGLACNAGVGACADAGVLVCAPDGTVTCDAVAGLPSTELCNGLDDNCDGSIDEGFVGACSVGVGACRAEGMLMCDAAGDVDGEELIVNGGFELPVLYGDFEYYFDEAAWPGWSRTRGTAIELQQISTAFEGQQYAELDSDSSSCFAQTVATVAGQRLNLSLAFSARTGVLDNRVAVIWNGDVIAILDDDGTGRADTVWQSHTFEVVAVGPESVVEFCDASESEPTLGGFIDGVSLRSAGGVICDAVPGAPSVEACNGIDDDCDGAIDEDFQLGLVCNSGTGVCGTTGLTVCAADGTLGCDAQPIDPIAEVCNGLDDDCDNSIDEDLGLGEACTAGVGACADAGVLVCAHDGTVLCDAQPGLPAYEVCNGIDDNCDGLVDEGFDLGETCHVGVGACERLGLVVCAADGALDCQGQPGNPAAEVCNGIDDNCDGSTDENLTQACGTDVGACAFGVSTCIDGGYGACEGAVDPAYEACNGIDDNCDGSIDEGFDLGAICSAGEGACAALGLTVCNADGMTCTAQPGAPQDEICDNLDNDCDGTVDEDCDACANVDCADGSFCRAGECVLSCADIACPSGQVCLDGACEDANCGGVLCGADQVCVQDACQDDACDPLQCTIGELCIANVCAADPCVGIVCPLNEACSVVDGTAQCLAAAPGILTPGEHRPEPADGADGADGEEQPADGIDGVAGVTEPNPLRGHPGCAAGAGGNTSPNPALLLLLLSPLALLRRRR